MNIFPLRRRRLLAAALLAPALPALPALAQPAAPAPLPWPNPLIPQRADPQRAGGVRCRRLRLSRGVTLHLPQGEHHEVLRVGEAERVEQRLVHLRHRQRGGIERETQLAVEAEQVPLGVGRGVRRRGGLGHVEILSLN